MIDLRKTCSKCAEGGDTRPLRDYSDEPLDKRTRKFAGLIVLCPNCKKRGLLRVFSWRRGRYQLTIIHTARLGLDGWPYPERSCQWDARTLKRIPEALQLPVHKLLRRRTR